MDLNGQPGLEIEAAAASVSSKASKKRAATPSSKRRATAVPPTAESAEPSSSSSRCKQEINMQEQQLNGIADAIVASNALTQQKVRQLLQQQQPENEETVVVVESTPPVVEVPTSKRKRSSDESSKNAKVRRSRNQSEDNGGGAAAATAAASASSSSNSGNLTILVCHRDGVEHMPCQVLNSLLPISGSGRNVKVTSPPPKKIEKFVSLLLTSNRKLTVEPLKMLPLNLEYGLQVHGAKNVSQFQLSIRNWEPLLKKDVIVHTADPQIDNVRLMLHNVGSTTVTIEAGDPIAVVRIFPLVKKITLVPVQLPENL